MDIAPQSIACPNCQGRTVCHDRALRRFRHGYAWHIGVLWIELFVPRQRCKNCGFTFTFDYGLGLVHSSTESFRREITKRCHGRSIAYQFHTSAVVSKIAKTVIVREKAMIDTINSPFSNGIMEGTNNKIKLIKRRGFGYRNDAHLFLRLRLETGH
ncbi:transposase [Lysinibacillus sp. G4S2]|uniref:transposase n=1 Tax=Lysinibacillus sp. G4S2 TaxID=3055859 RepID=UPI00338E3230